MSGYRLTAEQKREALERVRQLRERLLTRKRPPRSPAADEQVNHEEPQR